MPPLSRRTLASLALPVGMAAQAAPPRQHSGVRMRDAAVALLEGSSVASRDALRFAFDAPLRRQWRYTPGPRQGLNLGSMRSTEQELAGALLASGLSPAGLTQARGVMQLADELRAARGSGGGSGAYAVALFGDPASGGAWGWRLEGHHLSLNFTMRGTEILSATPHCVCADPMEVERGEHAGLAPLDRERYMARDLARSLAEPQMALARMPGPVPRDIQAGPGRDSTKFDLVGLPYAALTSETQRHLMLGLAETYLMHLPADLARPELARVSGSGRTTLRFAWAGGLEEDAQQAYRLQGDGLFIEYSTRGRPDHVHTLYRRPGLDFGGPTLG
ncbi:DUF3500 domain-containing protein [Pseudoroseomonas globiformis]|uniref:DUF3500 domain-containing protein n=1 Tax=Teichococcus globiformis TaxID=2307229 RepID=A0ABV7FX15_9PROT